MGKQQARSFFATLCSLLRFERRIAGFTPKDVDWYR